MNDSPFRPSSIPSDTRFFGSEFENGTHDSAIEKDARKDLKEAVSAFVVTFLARKDEGGNGDDWNTEIEWSAFEQWLMGNAPVFPLHRAAVWMDLKATATAIRALVVDGYLEARDGDNTKYYRVTEKYVSFFRRYAA